MTATNEQQPISFWEKADLYPAQVAILGTALYSSITGVFRGSSGSKEYKLHVANSVLRKMCVRLTLKQFQYVEPRSLRYPRIRSSLQSVYNIAELVNTTATGLSSLLRTRHTRRS